MDMRACGQTTQPKDTLTGRSRPTVAHPRLKARACRFRVLPKSMVNAHATLPPRRTTSGSSFLAAKIAALRRKQVTISALTGVAIAVGVAVELLALTMFFDWWLDLAWGVRLLLLGAQMGLMTFILLRFVVRPMIYRPDDDELALMVEKARSIFRSRLIAAIQLTRPGAVPEGASRALVGAMVEETEAMAAPMDFNDIVSTDKFKRLGLVASVVSLLGLAGLLSGGATATDLLKRVFLSNTPVPRKTRVTVVEGNKVIGRGDSVRLEARVGGVIPSSGKVEVKYSGRRPQDFHLEQDRENRRRFGRTIDNVQDNFSYRFYLNDGESPAYEVKTIPRPTILSLQCDQEFPAYTRRKPLRRALGDLSLLAGSRIALTGASTKALQSAALRFLGAPAAVSVPVLAAFPPRPLFRTISAEIVPMTLSGSNSKEIYGEFRVPSKGLAGFSVLLLDTEGMESRDSTVYRVDCIPDKAPSIRITYPDRKEELITRQATMPVAFEASDDFEIATLRLRYKVDTLDGGADKTVELDLEGQHPQRLKRRHEWNIGAFNPPLPEGSKIEYWIEAEDNNDTTGPGVGASEHQFAKVVSESEKRADLLNRAGDYLGSISDLASDQEKLNQKLGAIIREKMRR